MLKVKLLHPDAIAPTCAHPGEDLAYDLYALENCVVSSGQPNTIQTGIAAYYDNFPDDWPYGLLIRDRSSLAAKGLMVAGGVIDAGYRGGITVVMNFVVDAPPWGDIPRTACYLINRGDKIAQMIPIPVLTGEGVQVVDELPPAARGEGGFGSTGR